jgi:phage terminase small subunit
VTAKNASRWLDPGSTEKYNGEMWSYIHEQLERIHSEKTADAKEVLEYLTSVMRGEHTEETLQLVGDGVQTISDISVSAKDRLKAAELIGKTYGIFTDKTDLNIAQPIVISGGETLED